MIGAVGLLGKYAIETNVQSRIILQEMYDTVQWELIDAAESYSLWFLMGLFSSSCCLIQIGLNALSFGCAGFNKCKSRHLAPAPPAPAPCTLHPHLAPAPVPCQMQSPFFLFHPSGALVSVSVSVSVLALRGAVHLCVCAFVRLCVHASAAKCARGYPLTEVTSLVRNAPCSSAAAPKGLALPDQRCSH